MSREGAGSAWLGAAFGALVWIAFAFAGRLALGTVAGVGCAGLIVGGLAVWPSRSRLPWFGLAVPLLSLPDLALGSPSLIRLALTVILGLAAVAAGRFWEGRETEPLEPAPLGPERSPKQLAPALLGAEPRREQLEPDPLERPAGSADPGGTTPSIRRIDVRVAVGLVLYALLAWAAITWKYIHFGDRVIAQDTGYFEQCFWGFVTGRNFFMGSSQAWWRYDPILTSHFAMHFSPLLFVVAGFYKLWSSYHVLHLLQILGVTFAAVPIYLLVREIDARAASLFCLAYLVNAAVYSQTQGAFHELAFAAPVVSWAVYFFLKQRLGPFLGCLALGLVVREDLALVACMAGAAGLLVRDGRSRRLAWIVLPVVIGVVGWVVAGKVMNSFGRSGGQVILALFSRFGKTQGEVVRGMVHAPGQVVEMLLEGHRSRYLIGLFRPGLFASLLSPLSLWIVPVLLINLLVRGAGTAWLDVHYSVYLPAVLIPAAIAVWLKGIPRLATVTNASPAAMRAVLASIMALISLLSLPDVLGREQLAAYARPADEAEVRAVLAAIPPEAPAAVPRFMVHAIARRERLFMVNRWRAYTRFDPEYVVVDRDFSRVHLNDGTFEPYKNLAERLATDPGYQVVLAEPHYILYRRLPGAPILSGGVPPEARAGLPDMAEGR